MGLDLDNVTESDNFYIMECYLLLQYNTRVNRPLSYNITQHSILSYHRSVFDGRPWTELYVSFCMKKYTPPSLEIMHTAVPQHSIDLCPKLESTCVYRVLIYTCTHMTYFLLFICFASPPLCSALNAMHYLNHRH
jgi:hypothetical protein